MHIRGGNQTGDDGNQDSTSNLNVVDDSVVVRTPHGTYKMQVDSNSAPNSYPNEYNSRKVSDETSNN